MESERSKLKALLTINWTWNRKNEHTRKWNCRTDTGNEKKNIITTTATQLISVAYFKDKKQLVFWWIKEYETTNRNKKRSYTRNTFKKTKNIIDLIDFKRLKATAKRTINDSKKQAWQHFTKTLTPSTNPLKIGERSNLLKMYQQLEISNSFKLIHTISWNQWTLLMNLFADLKKTVKICHWTLYFLHIKIKMKTMIYSIYHKQYRSKRMT